MPFSAVNKNDLSAFDDYVDLRSVPRHRHFVRHSIVDRMRLAVPFDHIAISGLDIDGYRFGQATSIDSDFPPAFIEAYAAEGLVGNDPFVKAAKSGQGIVVESEVWKTCEPPQRLLYLMRSFKILNRTLIPVRRNDIVYGGVCFTRVHPFDAEELAFLELVAEPVHTTIVRPLMEKFATAQMKLTAGEVACLTQASFGLTSEAIAAVTGYQADTVNSYIKNAIKKLGCANRTQAIAEALRRRLIS